MALWRLGRGWNEKTMKSYLAALADSPVNFDTPPEAMTPENGWKIDGSHDCIGTEPPGPPLEDGLFARARQALINYDFSDPTIVEAHFEPDAPFVGRDMLLEIKVMGFRFLNGCRVYGVREESEEKQTIFGFRYDTLQGHIEKGYEWFLLTKDHETGEIWFKIEAHWQLGRFPNWWSKLGFKLIGERYRELWRHRAPQRLSRLAHQPVEKAVVAPGEELAHRGDPKPQRTEPTRTD
ncbi:MAG: DUF1990 domain-containing protein [Armatimonadota bacterium]|nr:DUF1990 domain-containing protein [Armatimonadota bacterium]